MENLLAVTLTSPVLAALISGVISWIVARSTAKGEIAKLKESWKRDDAVANREQLSKLSAALSRYQQFPDVPIHQYAMSEAALDLLPFVSAEAGARLQRVSRLVSDAQSEEAVNETYTLLTVLSENGGR